MRSSRLSPKRRPSRLLPHRLLTHHRLPSPTLVLQSVPGRSNQPGGHTDDSGLFRVPPTDSKIRWATHLVHRRNVPPGGDHPAGVTGLGKSVTMSLHKLTAGSGYDYLTRQIAASDATEKGPVGLAAYYTERGESPGVWVGSGLAGIDGLDVGDPVTAEQMCNLFGCGLHPLADARAQQFEGSDLTLDTIEKTMRLGTPFRGRR